MKHHILVKFNPGMTTEEKDALMPELRTLFEGALAIEGITSYELLRNCVDRENRYDLMIVIGMAPEALPLWDASETHRTWKSRYGALLEKKAIFDCE